MLSIVKKLQATKLATWLLYVLAFLGYSWQLTRLPVFADEAIYIRWSQLVIDDWSRYLFFPLNDGKTPLFMWLLVPGQLSSLDPLFAARLLSVIAGLTLMYLVGKIMVAMGGTQRSAMIGQLLTAGLPFWFFSARLALIDTLLVTLIAAATWQAVCYVKTKKWHHIFLSGLWLGLALWTKLPAVLAIPMIGVVALTTLLAQAGQNRFVKSVVIVACTLAGITVLGGFIFGLMKLHPAFGQLFSRGSDFLYPFTELSLVHVWQNFFRHLKDFSLVFFTYLTGSGMLLALMAVFLPTHRRRLLGLWLAAVSYCLPIMLVGKVVYPRYVLPAALPLTLAIAFAIENFIVAIQLQKDFLRKTILSVVLAFSLAYVVSFSVAFWLYGWLSPNQLPLTFADKVQYLSEWSAGNGLEQTAAAIREAAKTQKILVLTEGYFGTLPDGILLYLHDVDVHNIFVEGIGQPVRSIPPKQVDQAQNYDVVWLVVNSHRLLMEPAPTKLVARYCRLQGDPCLEVWDITEIVKK